jgi:hypothetical protein
MGVWRFLRSDLQHLNELIVPGYALLGLVSPASILYLSPMNRLPRCCHEPHCSITPGEQRLKLCSALSPQWDRVNLL